MICKNLRLPLPSIVIIIRKLKIMKRLCIYFFYDKDGIVDDYVSFFLEAIKKYYDKTYVVVNGHINKEGIEKIQPYVEDIWCRENMGLDAWAYKFALEKIGYECIKKYDEILLTNFTCFGPIFPLEEMYSTMDKRNCDFWGLTAHPIVKSPSDTEIHIQSYFISYRTNILKSSVFKKYWDKLPEINSYQDSVYKHELVQTLYFCSYGFIQDSYIPISKYISETPQNAILTCADRQLIEDRCPFFKRRLFYFDEKNTTVPLVKIKYITDYIKGFTKYKFNLITQNILRTQNIKKKCKKVKEIFYSFIIKIIPNSKKAQRYKRKLNYESDYYLKCFSENIFPPTAGKDIACRFSLNSKKNTYYQSDTLFCNPNTYVGAFCSIGERCIFGHGEHPSNYLSTSPYFYFEELNYKSQTTPAYPKFWLPKHIIIGNDVWIGDGVFIKNGITIGDGSIIGARSVVTKDVPPYAIVAGSPAKIIKYRFDEKRIKELLKLRWWDLDDAIIKQIPYDNIDNAINFLKTVRGIL